MASLVPDDETTVEQDRNGCSRRFNKHFKSWCAACNERKESSRCKNKKKLNSRFFLILLHVHDMYVACTVVYIITSTCNITYIIHTCMHIVYYV